MLRVVVQNTDYGVAGNIGGPVENTIKSFEVACPALEAYLKKYEDDKAAQDANPDTQRYRIWYSRTVVGVEIIH